MALGGVPQMIEGAEQEDRITTDVGEDGQAGC
jgi:hypothetical protein